MPKYLFQAHYNPEGAIGLAKEGGTGRRDAVKKHLEDVGGKLDQCISRSAKSIVLLSSTCRTM